MTTKQRQKSVKVLNYWTFDHMSPAIEAAYYYGFTPIDFISPEKSDRDICRAINFDKCKEFLFHPEEKSALIRHYFAKGIPGLPVMVAYKRTDKHDPKKEEYGFDILGTNKSVADASIIKISYELAKQYGYEDITLEINSLGDRESLARFARELTHTLKKHLGELHPDCRQAFKKSPFLVLTCTHEKCKTIKEQAPHAINFLSEPSRVYFMELLETLETIQIPYTINDNLVDNPECATHIVFKMHGHEPHKESELIAHGSRWTNIAKRLSLKKDIPCVSGTVSLPKVKADKSKKIKKPQIYFIQMGQEAKLKSLNLIEILRQAKIPMYHSLTKDKLTAQILSAENLKTPYMLIMGQKESLDNTVLVRQVQNRSQDTVRLDRVADHLKKLLK